MEDGKQKTAIRSLGYRIVRGGGAFVVPIIERIGWMSLESITLETRLTGIRTKNGPILTVDLTSQIGIKADEESLRNASVHYLDKTPAMIADAAQKVIESRARMMLAGMTSDEINADLNVTETKLGEKIHEDLHRTGLALSVLVLREVHVEKSPENRVSNESINIGDLFKVIRNSNGELIVQKVKTGVEG